jgi:poly-beta-1,6-N-acetyl-D-glucosamine synthase
MHYSMTMEHREPPGPARIKRVKYPDPAPPVGAMKVIALVPVHNELEFYHTIEALQSQTRPPDLIYICLDNCEDERIWKLAMGYDGVAVCMTVGNVKDKKAGNLNRITEMIMPGLGFDDTIFGFDADSVPEPDFIENALEWMRRGYGAIGATFNGRRGGGLLGLLQRSEFARFARHQHRKLHADVLSGTGWGFPVWALWRIAASRDDGQVYDVNFVTEDFELTMRARQLGIRCIAPANCRVTTDVMTTWKDWKTQRDRWQLGTLETLRAYGWTQHTRGMITRQAMFYVVMIATPLTAVYLGWSVALFGLQGINPLHAPVYALGIGLVICEQAWQCRQAGTKSIGATLGIIPDLAYSVARQLIYVRALWRLIRRRRVAWGAGTQI